MAKQTIEGKVQTRDHRIFTVQRAADSEQDVLLDFGMTVNYQVVKLAIADLPPEDTDGKKITWINNWGVIDTSGNYVESVNYTVFLPARANATFVYYDRGGLKRDKTPVVKGARRARSGMVQVDFDTGDPAGGYK